MKKRPADQTPALSAADYGRNLKGIGFNLLVKDVPRAVNFATQVLGAKSLYDDVDFAALRLCGGDMMFHADHTYADNPLSGLVRGVDGRGAGVELRVYGCDPDQAEAAARRLGHTVLAGSMDKPHGLRECVILDDEGYAWVPGIALAE